MSIARENTAHLPLRSPVFFGERAGRPYIIPHKRREMTRDDTFAILQNRSPFVAEEE
ncbi:hypothetical protein [Jannaschia sp. CCS1]|uniref:hypothetical protein n=1 Tax=Jannaschia sp. (strain CCS1) TaxID=290400 RepID=UPI0002E6F6E4|nr:hypothetical protein [Jannaschia sp. CCS1]